MSRVVIIGAGVGGLASAARLATLGHDVTLCEQSPVIGGKLGIHEEQGFTFDTGPSLVTMPQVFGELFASTGDPLNSVLTLRPVEPIARYRFADGTMLDSTADLTTFCDSLDEALGEGNGDDWRRFMQRAERIWDATHVPFLESPLHGIRSLLRQAYKVGDLATIAPWKTLRTLGTHYLRDPRLRMFLDRYATYTGSDPRKAPAALAVVPYVEQAFGAWYVEGGLHLLGQAIADRAVERGATLRLDTEVTAITVTGNLVDGVTLADGSHLEADVVVANADASVVYRDLLPRKAMQRQLARTTPSLSGFVVLLGLRGRTEGLAHHTVLFPEDYDAEFDAVFGGRLADDPTVYISAPVDAATAPDGDEAWFVLVNAARNGLVDWDAQAVDYATHVVDLMARRGFDVRDRIAVREVRSPADLERATRSPGGSIYGSSSNGPMAAFLRPANASGVTGLFLVGGSSHPGGGLPLVTLSAKIVAGLVGPA
ncbi:phytoene desaturase family protein [Acidothermaceae bacterium B102]|nr:phytoene desaturase family protein [Acidothermaceae bacterium B102]